MATPDALAALQIRLGHAFREARLLQQALTHRSFSSDHNERLEFLGDSVLNLAVAHFLFEQLSTLPEGDLSRVRANLVKQDTLHNLALEMGLSACIRLGEGELRSGGARRASLLADALEGLIGAKPAEPLLTIIAAPEFIVMERKVAEAQGATAAKDAKTELQEWLQGRKIALPRYSVIATSGAAHRQTFEVACEVSDFRQYGRGSGSSRRAAEQAAAAALLDILKNPS